uniref:Uncharacterized protein n=2 Tax=Avena sativa TaxID=4498 RepID=A0ACD5XME8_AVESA
MGLMELSLLMSIQRGRRRQRIQTNDGSLTSVSKRKSPPFQQDGNSDGGKRMKYPGPVLPEEIWCHIHSLMPMQAAAQAACVSRSFLDSWRCYPNLTFSRGIQCRNVNAHEKDEIVTNLTTKVDRSLVKHSGITKKLKLEFYNCNVKACDLDRWLQIGVTPAIEELTVQLPWDRKKYKFPWPLLSNGSGNSIRYLNLSNCAFRPTVRLGLRSLTKLCLCDVRITGDELACLLDSAFVLEQLILQRCSKIISLKIPSWLQKLSDLEVFECERLQAMEVEAQYISKINFAAVDELGQLSLGQSLQLKILEISYYGAVCYARAELPSSFPSLESLTIFSWSEMVSTPMVPSKFSYLKHLRVVFPARSLSPTYDHCSLISFFDASPSLETFFLQVVPMYAKHPSIFADPSDLRKMPEHRHDKLKNVKIVGFSSSKSLVELTCHILESTTSLEYLTLDTTDGHSPPRCSSVHNMGKCFPIDRDVILEAHKALLAIRTYIQGIVPSKVKFTVGKPCSQCHAV